MTFMAAYPLEHLHLLVYPDRHAGRSRDRKGAILTSVAPILKTSLKPNAKVREPIYGQGTPISLRSTCEPDDATRRDTCLKERYQQLDGTTAGKLQEKRTRESSFR